MIEEKDMEHLREVFMTRQECDTKNDSIKDTMYQIDKRLSIMEAMQQRQDHKSSTILAAVISNMVAVAVACIIFAIKMGAV